VNEAPTPRRSAPLVLLWLLVALEFLSPVPAFLTFGAAWVLLARPRWFLELVRALYEPAPGGE
jgi:hypothetical protein